MSLRNDHTIFYTIVILYYMTVANCDIFEECNDILTTYRTFVVSSKSCSHYIFCDGDDSYEGECGEDSYFNVIYQTCDPKELVDCRIGDATTVSTVSATTRAPIFTAFTTVFSTRPTASVVNATNITQPTTVSSATTILPNTTASFVTANPFPTTDASTVTSTTAKSTVISPNVVISTECPDTDNHNQLIFVPHPKSCSDYYICYHGEPIAMHCSAMLHFDVNSGKCDYPENIKCHLDVSSVKEQCQSHTVDMYPHPNNCNYFYFCKNGYLLLQQCPFLYGWDFERRACVALNQANCYNQRKRV